MNMAEHLYPNTIPKVDEKCAADRFENAIREFGVGNACEWFGHYFDSEFSLESVKILCERAGIELEKLNEIHG